MPRSIEHTLASVYLAGMALTFLTGSLTLFSLWSAAPLLALGAASLGQLLMHRIHAGMHSQEPDRRYRS